MADFGALEQSTKEELEMLGVAHSGVPDDSNGRGYSQTFVRRVRVYERSKGKGRGATQKNILWILISLICLRRDLICIVVDA